MSFLLKAQVESSRCVTFGVRSIVWETAFKFGRRHLGELDFVDEFSKILIICNWDPNLFNNVSRSETIFIKIENCYCTKMRS